MQTDKNTDTVYRNVWENFCWTPPGKVEIRHERKQQKNIFSEKWCEK